MSRKLGEYKHAQEIENKKSEMCEYKIAREIETNLTGVTPYP